MRAPTYRNLGHKIHLSHTCLQPKNRLQNTKKPPGNRAAFSLGRIVPTEAKPSELSGCILSLAKTGVKAKSNKSQHVENNKDKVP